MGRSEDYLDSLLDSLNETDDSKPSELDISSLMDEIDIDDSEIKEEVKEAPKKRTPETEASYLDAFERELSEELGGDQSSFLREFESDLGLEPDYDLDSNESSFQTGIEEKLESLDDIINSAEGETSSLVDASSDIDVLDILNNIDAPESNDSEVSETPNAVEESPQTPSDDSSDSSSEPTSEEDDDFISDIDDGEAKAGEGESEAGKSEEVSQDEILDIGDLLDSIDEEGNLSEAEMESKPGDAVDEDASSSEEPKKDDNASKEGKEESPEGEEKKKKPGLLAKIISILFSTGEEKEGKEEEEKPEESGEAIEEESPIDKKQAKKEEKERKKKEKEEAKKKAKEEKDKKAKEKPPKAPKQKKPKVPDKSPKIPLIAILAFLLLSASMVVLWFVAQKTISHALFINSAKSSFDHQEYMSSYQKLSGLEEYSEEELILYNRAKIMAMLEYRIKAYEQYVEREEHINAVDALVRGSVYYNAHKREANEMGIPSEYEELGRYINEKLSTVYGISEQDAKDLMSLRERKNYTRELYRILEREGLWSYKKP